MSPLSLNRPPRWRVALLATAAWLLPATSSAAGSRRSTSATFAPASASAWA